MSSLHRKDCSGQTPRARRHRGRRPNSILQASTLISALHFISHRSLNWTRGLNGLGGAAAVRRTDTFACGNFAADGINSTTTTNKPLNPQHARRGGGCITCSAESARHGSISAHPAGGSEPASGVSGQAPLGVPPSTSADSEAAIRGLTSMAQLASAWAQVSSRLAEAAVPASSPWAEGALVEAAVATGHLGQGGAAGAGLENGVPRAGAPIAESDQDDRAVGEAGGAGGRRAEGGAGWRGPPLLPAGRQDGSECGTLSYGSLPGGPLGLPAVATEGASQRSAPTQAAGASAGDRPSPSQQHRDTMNLLLPHQYPQQQQHQEPGQQAPLPPPARPHFEAIITALKLALASLQTAQPRRDGRSPATRAVQLASTLADLCAAGLPLDAAAMCAGVVAEAAELGALCHDVIRAQLGPEVAALVHDMLRVRQAPRRIELLDDEGASAVREWCLAFHDVRACVVEVVSWWDELQHMAALPLFEQQALALEALQIGAPLGHALGLGALSAVMEDMCLKVLFPESYASTSAWLRGLMDPAEDALFAAQQRLLAALDEHPDFGRLAGGLVVKARTKSLFSVMKKLLHLGDLARGGRRREELYDLLGMRAVVRPPDFLPPAESEAAATKACYIVQDVACKLWRPIPSRSKDYIVTPKANGYQSIHLTMQLGQLDMSYDTYGTGSGSSSPPSVPPSNMDSPSAPGSPHTLSGAGAPTSLMSSIPLSSCEWDQWPTVSSSAAVTLPVVPGDPRVGAHHSAPLPTNRASGPDPAMAAAAAAEASAGGPLCMELQIRTAAMDLAAESGDAAHAVYKGGLDARTARQLQAWTQELQRRLAAQPRGRLLLRAAASSAATGTVAADDAASAERRRKRRERRAAAAAAAAALAAAQAQAAAAAQVAPTVQPAAAADVSRPVAADGLVTVGAARSRQQTPLVHTASFSAGGGTAVKLMPPPRRPPPATAAVPRASGGPGSRGAGLPDAVAAVMGADGDTTTAAGISCPSDVRPSPSHAQVAPQSSPARPQLAAPGASSPGASAPPAAANQVESVPSSPPTPGPLADILPSPGWTHARGDSAERRTQCGVNGPPAELLLPPLSHKHHPQQEHSSQSQPPQSRQQQPQPKADSLPDSDPAVVADPLRQQLQQQRLALFSSLGSMDEAEEPLPLGAVIGLGQRDAAAAAEQLFRHLDVNGDGRLSLGEVRQVLMDLAAPSSERDAAALMAALDRNGDGGVSVEEFVEGLGRAQQQQRSYDA